MTSSSSILSLAQRALLSVGARSNIASLQENSTESNAISVLYQPTFEQLARTAPWNCLRRQEALTLLAAAKGTPENPLGTTLPLPPQPFLYMYALPSDNLQIRYLMPLFPPDMGVGNIPLTTFDNSCDQTYNQYGISGQIPFTVSYTTDAQNNPLEVVLTNLRMAQAVYTANQPNPAIFDSLFEAGLVASIAAFLVPALSLDLPLMQLSIKMAEATIANARVRDGDEGVVSQNREADWITARNRGGRTGWADGGSHMGYGQMSWPMG